MRRNVTLAFGALFGLIVAVVGAQIAGRLDQWLSPPACLIELRRIGTEAEMFHEALRPAVLWRVRVAGTGGQPEELRFTAGGPGASLYGLKLLDPQGAVGRHPQSGQMCTATIDEICPHITPDQWDHCDPPVSGPPFSHGFAVGCRDRVSFDVWPAPRAAALVVAAFPSSPQTASQSIKLSGTYGGGDCVFVERVLPRWLGLLLTLLAMTAGFLVAYAAQSWLKTRGGET